MPRAVPDLHGPSPESVILKTDPLTCMHEGKIYSLGMAPKPKPKVVDWEVPTKKKPKAIGMPGGYDERLLTENKPETLDGQSQVAYNAIHATDMKLHKAKIVADGKVLKNQVEKGVDIPLHCACI